MDWITTYSGNKLDIESVNPNITIRDIAHGLSLTCRFAGMCKEFYSVGMHSIILSNILFNESGNNNYAIVALMHDAAEFVFGDIPTPIKKVMPEYKKYHDLFLKNIFKKFNLNFNFLKEIDKYDKRLALTEAEYLGINTSDWQLYKDYKPYQINLFNMRNPLDVEDMFRERYHDYK